MEKLLRNYFLYLSKNQMLIKLAKRHGLKLGANRFVAGETLESSIKIIKELNNKGMSTTIDHLGEFVSSTDEANLMMKHCLKSLEVIEREKLDAQLSLKLTSLGLDISKELVEGNLQTILEMAMKHNNFITIDMEDYAHCQQTIDIFTNLRMKYDNIGTVLQAYLYRTEQDIEAMNELKANLRLVKGAYKEPATVAFPDKRDVDNNYKRIIKQHLSNGNYTAIATHDDKIIEFTKQLVLEHNIPNSQFEFQMLYGIRTDKQNELVRNGYKMRVYVPYGADWYGYFMRRLAERPANVAFILKSLR